MEVTGGIKGVGVRVADRVIVNGERVGEEDGASGDGMIFVVEWGGSETFDGEGITRAESKDFFDGRTAVTKCQRYHRTEQAPYLGASRRNLRVRQIWNIGESWCTLRSDDPAEFIRDQLLRFRCSREVQNQIMQCHRRGLRARFNQT